MPKCSGKYFVTRRSLRVISKLSIFESNLVLQIAPEEIPQRVAWS